VTSTIRTDGITVLRLLSDNAGDLAAAAVVHLLWDNFEKKKANPGFNEDTLEKNPNQGHNVDTMGKKPNQDYNADTLEKKPLMLH
jgi:hypothetical protein